MSKYFTAFSRTSDEEVTAILARTYTDDTSGCMLWRGAVNTDGYPAGSRRRKDNFRVECNVKLHRHLYEHMHGVILGKGDVIRHSCDNPLCLNPEHLSIGTMTDNMVDRRDRARTHGHVSGAEIAAVREALLQGKKFVDVATDLGITTKRLKYIRVKYLV